MGVIRLVNIKIVGQVPDDRWNNEYEVLMAELRLIASRYDLTLVESSDD